MDLLGRLPEGGLARIDSLRGKNNAFGKAKPHPEMVGAGPFTSLCVGLTGQINYSEITSVAKMTTKAPSLC